MTASHLRSTVLPDCRPLLADPDDLTLVFQPIVDLAVARVAGYAALPRFPGTASPDVWSAAARDLGVEAELAALVLHGALAARSDLPPDTFLTVDVAPHLLGSAPVRAALRTVDDLRPIVVRLTGDAGVDDLAALHRQTEALRASGAVLAMEGAGRGGPGLDVLAAIGPQLLTLDGAPSGAPSGGADGGPARTAVAGLVGDVAGRIGAVLLAQGIDTPADLAAVPRSGAALGRGWLLGRPAPDFRPLTPDAERLVRAHAARSRLTDTVAGLVRPVRQVDAGDPLPGVPPVVLVGADAEPLALRLADPRTGAVHTAPVALSVPPDADVRQTLRRALTRPPAQRFDPVVCTDPTGAVVGLLRLDDLAAAAAACSPSSTAS